MDSLLIRLEYEIFLHHRYEALVDSRLDASGSARKDAKELGHGRDANVVTFWCKLAAERTLQRCLFLVAYWTVEFAQSAVLTGGRSPKMVSRRDNPFLL